MSIAGKVALVTGGSRGIGAAIVRCLAAQSVIVVINYHHNGDAANRLAKEIRSMSGHGLTIQADVRVTKSVRQMVATVLKSYGHLDILVNNAGINHDALLCNVRDEDWRDVMNTNCFGVFSCSRAVLETMMIQKWGRIINISSIVAESPLAGQSLYAASKGAINAFTRALAAEVAAKGITVNAVAPGFIMTDMVRKVGKPTEKYSKTLIPMRRIGIPEEVAAVVTFLVSDKASYLTGEIIRVDGGLP